MKRHGSTYERCCRCRFYRTSPYEEIIQRGRCYRRSPRADANTDYAEWPIVENKDWCGEYEGVKK